MSVRWAIGPMLVLGLAACSSGGGVTTGSLLGEEGKSAAAPAQPSNDPTARALQVGTVSARATRCGYNFDAPALKSKYLAYEAAQGAQVADLGRLEVVYDTGFNGVSKAAAADPNYCNAARTAEIKTDLTRHLAGDYSAPQKVAKVEEQGFLGGFFDADNVETGPSFGSDDWWSSQQDKVR